jgi:hypothetical protein
LINVKPDIVAALTDDSALSSLIDGRAIFHGPPDKARLPCITYREENNAPALMGDGKELTSESVIVIDVWSLGSTTAIAKAVDDVMAGLRFVREFAGDLYETDTGVYHKSMRYRIKTRR